MAIIKPYGSVADIPGFTDGGFVSSDFPALKHCWPCTETGGLSVTDALGGVVISRASTALTNPANGVVSFGGTTQCDSCVGTFEAVPAAADSLMVWIAKDSSTAQKYYMADGAGVSGWAFENNVAGVSYYVEDGSNYASGDSASEPVLSSSAYQVLAMKVDVSATYPITIGLMNTTQTSITNNASTTATTGSVGAGFTPDQSGGSVFWPIRGAEVCGAMLFYFEDGLPADIDIALAWMLADWVPQADGSAGKKRVYPGWKHVS